MMGSLTPKMRVAHRVTEPATDGNEDNANLVSTGYPHAKVFRAWDSLIKYTKAAYKDNESDFRDALRDLCGPAKEAAEGQQSAVAKKDKTFASPIFTSDFLKIISFYNSRSPKAAIKAARGIESKPLADATAMLSDRCAYETGEREQDALAIAEAICRNHGYVRSGWDRYRWLPTFKYVRGEVRLDPDCEGDIRSAKYGFEEVEIQLADLLTDEEIPADIRKELRLKTDTHRKARFLREDGSMSFTGADKDYATTQEWDAPHMAKVVAYRIFSLIGPCPGMYDDDKPDSYDSVEAESKPQDPDLMPGFERVDQKSSMHTYLKTPPEVQDDARPEAAEFDPLEHGRRVYILMVAGFNKILKHSDWPLDHFDRDELPWVECRPISIPGLLHGMNIYRMIRPYMRVINDAIEFWVASERRGAKRIILADESIPTSEIEKLESDNMYEVLRFPGANQASIRVVEFGGRNTSFKELIPAFMKLHDDTTGMNEAVSGRAPQVEETASAARMRQDQAVAALSYIENAVDAYHERKTRMRVAALQRYVKRETTYAVCDWCEGAGEVLVPVGDKVVPVPCEECRGTGRGRILEKGADFWLPAENAQAWRDDLSLDEIRGEVIVGVELGSSRTDYAERQVALLTTFIDRWAPIYLQFGLAEELHAAIEKHKDALGVSNGDALSPSLDRLKQAIQAQQQAAAAAGQKPGKSPEEIQAEIQAKQHEAQMAEAAHGLEERKANLEAEFKAAQIQVQMMQVQVQFASAQLQAQTQRDNAQLGESNKSAVTDLKRVEGERKYELERSRVDSQNEESANASATFSEFTGFSEKMSGALDAITDKIVAADERGAELHTKMIEVVDGMKQCVDGVVSEKTETPAALDDIKRLLMAPVAVLKDKDGRVTGGQRVPPKEEES